MIELPRSIDVEYTDASSVERLGTTLVATIADQLTESPVSSQSVH